MASGPAGTSDADKALAQFRVTPDRVYLDNFTIKRLTGGQRFAPHAGQSVWVIPYGGGVDAAFDQVGVQSALAAGDDVKLDKSIAAMCSVIAERLAAWDVCDVTGVPFAQPFRQPDVVRSLPAALVWHLYSVVLGIEPEGNADGGEADSPPTFSTTPARAARTRAAKAAPARRRS